MLSINSEEKAQQIESQIEQARRAKPKPEIEITPIDASLPSMAVFTNVETGMSTYFVDSAPENFLDTLNLAKFEITVKKKSEIHEGLYDFTYVDKK